MSQVLRRLKLMADSGGTSSRSYFFHSPLLQTSFNESASYGSTYSRKQLLRHQTSLYHTECVLQNTNTQTRVKPIQIQNRRSMSMLTDLLRRKKKPDDEDEDSESPQEGKTLPLYIEEPKQLTEEEIEAKRNISRLKPYHQRMVNCQMPWQEPAEWFHHTVKFKARMFGKYGESSGVNPGIIWPTHKQLKDRIEYENICNPWTIQEMVERKRAIRQQEQIAREKRIKMVQTNMEKLEEIKKDLFRRQEAKENEASEARERREKLVEEVRRHFGYTVDSRDERFQEMLEKKEKEQKKNMKEARKLERQQRVLDKMQGKPVSKTKEQVKPVAKKAEDDDDD